MDAQPSVVLMAPLGMDTGDPELKSIPAPLPKYQMLFSFWAWLCSGNRKTVSNKNFRTTLKRCKRCFISVGNWVSKANEVFEFSKAHFGQRMAFLEEKMGLLKVDELESDRNIFTGFSSRNE